MNTERTIIIENVSKQPIGLKDTQGRTYRLGIDAKIRISEVSLQDILDYPASKIIFNEELVKLRNVDADTLFRMGLTDQEIEKYSLEDVKAVVIKEEISAPEEEIVETVEEEKPVVKPAAKKAPAKKTTTTTKKASSTKGK